MDNRSMREEVIRLVLAAVREPGTSFPGGSFVRSLLLADAGDRRWPFDLEHVLALDPAMANIPADHRPWGGGG